MKTQSTIHRPRATAAALVNSGELPGRWFDVIVVRLFVVLVWLGVVVLGAGCTNPFEPVGASGTEGSSEGTGGEEGTGADESETGADTGVDTGADETGEAEPVCGNGIVEAGESCDDEGESARCDADCSPVDCGDGLLNVLAGEQCDDGGQSETCNLDCTLVHCGDGLVNAEGEQCDDGAESAFCDLDCTVAACGDGVFNATAGEECDDGRSTAGCDEDCTAVVCGDLYVNGAAGEECEGDELAGGTCEGLGFDVGTLACGAGCSYDVSECHVLPGVPVLQLDFSQVKLFDFNWAAVADADYYQLEESVAPGEPFVQLGGDIVGESVSHEMPLHFRWQASYRLWACNGWGCTESAVVDVMGSLVDAVGYVKASNTDVGDHFGYSVALSGDGNTLAVGAPWEGSNATGVNPGPAAEADDSAGHAGAIYVFVRDGMGSWSQQAYVKASNTDASDNFGISVALSGDGNTLAVGAHQEDSNATGVNPGPAAEADDSASAAGAVYLY